MVMLATLKVMARPGGAGGAVLALWPQGIEPPASFLPIGLECRPGTADKGWGLDKSL